jgi:hypothetical protein
MSGRPVTNSELRHRWSIGHNYLAGITAGDWWRLLQQNNFAVSPAYWHRAIFITATSVINSFNWHRERKRYDKAIDQVTITKPPLFILGHWRSGTTLLHYLLALDQEQFTFANTFQVVNPKTFLTTEQFMARRLSWLVPPTRPMDEMPQSFSSPQEDEFAPLLLSFCSPYIGISFPARIDHYSRFLTFRDASPQDVARWKDAFVWFCKKLTLNADADKSLLLKSPAHTARIRLLLDMFPDARFLHIHRDPYRVFQSQRHFFNTAAWYTYLQKPDLSRIDEGILNRYRSMYEAYFDDLPHVPQGRFCEVRFEDLERDPVAVTEYIYQSLSLPGFGAIEPALRSYARSLSDYRKNDFEPLDDRSRRLVAERWERNFQTWGYAI